MFQQPLDERRVVNARSFDHPLHQAASRTLYAQGKRAQRLAQRDQRLLANQHPGDTDRRYQAAYRYAKRWGLPLPAGRRNRTAR